MCCRKDILWFCVSVSVSHLNLLNMIETKIVCIFIKVSRHINDEERMIRIDFRGQSSNDKVLPH